MKKQTSILISALLILALALALFGAFAAALWLLGEAGIRLFAAILLGLWALAAFGLGNAASGRVKGRVRRIEAERLGRRAEFFALEDTGSSLREPVSGRSVIVADAQTLRGLFDSGTYEIIRSAGPVEAMARLGAGYMLVPYRALGTGSGLLLAFRPDSLLVDGEESGSLIAVSGGEIIEGRGYSAILPAE